MPVTRSRFTALQRHTELTMRILHVVLAPSRALDIGPQMAHLDLARATGVAGALESIRSAPPDVIVLDVGTESGP